MSEQAPTSSSIFLGLAGTRSRWLVAELVVIVAGILIALGIDEWRQNVEDSRVERLYLQQLVSDLQATENHIRDVVAELAPNDAAANRLVRMFEDNTVPNLSDVRSVLSQIRFMDNAVPVLATSDALISTGDLRLISNPEVQNAIAQYIARGRDYWLVPMYQREDRHRESVFQVYRFAEKYGIAPDYRLGVAGAVSDSPREPNLEDFFSDADAYSHATSLAEGRAIFGWFRESMAAEANELRILVEKELTNNQ
jgi:hypothetical protein